MTQLELSNSRLAEYSCEMPHASPSLLFRLRRHRGLMVLAIAVLLLKFVAGTACLAYDTDKRVVSTSSATTVTMPVDIASTVSPDTDASDCLLGEIGGCHCTCAHNVPLATTGSMPMLALATPSLSALLLRARAPAISGSVHRPPIA